MHQSRTLQISMHMLSFMQNPCEDMCTLTLGCYIASNSILYWNLHLDITEGILLYSILI